MESKGISRRTFLATAGTVLASLTLPLASGPVKALAAEGDASGSEAKPIVILHTNDVHCALSNPATKLGYAALVGYANAQREKYGKANVSLVDAGDNVQGDFEGAFTKGEAPAKVIAACGYDLLTPGNHEFDYGMDQFDQLRQTEKGVSYVCCNFVDKNNNRIFDAYRILEYQTERGPVRIAYVGATTPSTLTSSTPGSFKDKDGNLIYGFCGDATGQMFYDAIQAAVNDARTNGRADYVVLLGHLGQIGSLDRWRSDTVVANTYGIDIVIDGHSHEKYVQRQKNKNGEEVAVVQTGTKFASFGRIEINPVTGTATANLDATGIPDEVYAQLIEKVTDDEDPTVAAVVQEIESELEKKKNTKVGTSEVLLRAYDDNGITWAVRKHETNLGDLAADAYFYYAANQGVICDIAVVNSGGVRANVGKGEVTYGNLVSVHPYMNQLCLLKLSGQHILNMLEVGAIDLPDAGGGFLQVCEGVSYTVLTSIPTPVVLSDDGTTVKEIVGERRVRNAKIGDTKIDPASTYTVVGSTYILVNGGNAMPIPANAEEAEFLKTDTEALIEYIQVNLKGTIGEEYANENGQGRIKLTDHDDGSDDDDSDKDKAGGEGEGDTDSPNNDDAAENSAGDGRKTTLPRTDDESTAAVAAAAALVGAGAAFAGKAALAESDS